MSCKHKTLESAALLDSSVAVSHIQSREKKFGALRAPHGRTNPTLYLCPGPPPSLVPRPFPPPVFDRILYAKTEGEGLGERVTCVTSGRREGRH